MNESLLKDFFKGETRALARVITLVENRSADSLEILQQLFPKTGQSRVIGVTGSPGVGKSSLVDRLAAASCTNEATRVVRGKVEAVILRRPPWGVR